MIHPLLSHQLNLLGRRIIPYVCSSYDHEKFIKWGFNCCRQTAIVTKYFLELPEVSAKYEITDVKAYVVDFVDSLWGEYDHGMNSCYSRGKRYLMDTATVSYPPMMVELMENTIDLPTISRLKTDISNQYIRATKITELTEEEAYESTEYFSGLPGKDFCEICVKLLLK